MVTQTAKNIKFTSFNLLNCNNFKKNQNILTLQLDFDRFKEAKKLFNLECIFVDYDKNKVNYYQINKYFYLFEKAFYLKYRLNLLMKYEILTRVYI